MHIRHHPYRDNIWLQGGIALGLLVMALAIQPSGAPQAGASVRAAGAAAPPPDWLAILSRTVKEWNEDDAPRLGAALAFYSMLSLGPLILIVIAIGSLAFGHDRASSFMMAELRTLLGKDGAGAIEDILTHSHSHARSVVAAAIGAATLVFSATGFFGQLQAAFNRIWNVPPQKASILAMARKRLLSFGLVAGAGVLLLFSLVVSAALSAVTGVFSDYTPALVAQALSVSLSFHVTTFIFVIAFKFLPDTPVAWSDVWIGALLTAFLFTIGKTLIGVYLGQSALSSTYGAAGSMIVLLVWIYYSAQIVFFGAELTQVYAATRPHRQAAHL